MKRLLRVAAGVLALALALPAISAEKAGAADTTWQSGPVKDKYADELYGYPDASLSFQQGILYVGYYTDGVYGSSTKGVIQFNLPARPAGVVVKSATLSVPIGFQSDDINMIGNPFIKVYGAQDDSWNEAGTDIPAYESNYIGESGDILSNSTFAIDARTFVEREWLQGTSSAASFVLTGTTVANVKNLPGVEIDASVGFYDHADSANGWKAPTLKIVYGTNAAPMNLTLAPSAIDENKAANSIVGTFSATDSDGDALTYSILTGDTSKFKISGNQLLTNASLDYEAGSSYLLMIQAADPYGGTVSNTFTVNVNDVNEAPTDITLSNSSIAENQTAGTEVGQLGAIDPDATKGPYTYSIESGLDGASFQISGDKLQSAAVFNYEAMKQYHLNVKVTDGSISFTKLITIAVTDVNEAPSSVSLSNTDIDEGLPAGTTVGTVSATDPDASDTLTYTVEGTDKDHFSLTGNVLKTAEKFDFVSKSSYSISIKATDAGGLSASGPFTIKVNDVNDAPTDIQLSNSSVSENSPMGTTVGTLTATDPDSTTPYAYSITGGDGAAKFTIESGNVLKTAADFDYETPPTTYDVKIRVTDNGGATYEKTFPIAVNDVNEAPTDIALSKTTIAENAAEDTAVGTLSAVDPDANEALSFEISGGDDASLFEIQGNELIAKDPFDYESGQTSYTVKIKAKDKGGLAYEKTFTIITTNVNEAPIGISLSGNTVEENKAAGTTVGTLSTTDPDAGDTFAYSITGGTDASSFRLVGNSLQTNEPLDYETKRSYEVNIRVTDSGSNSIEKTFTITALDVNEAPMGLLLSASEVNEGMPAGTTIGTISAIDPDEGDTFQYDIVGGADQGSFEISGNTLKTAESFDYESKSSYSLDIRAKDSGDLTYTKTIAIAVGDVNEKPTGITLLNDTVDENEPSGTTVGTLAATDPDTGDTFSFSIDAASGSVPFIITGNTISTTSALDYETKNSYDVPVKVTDSGGLSYSKTFKVSVNDVNDAPTDIALSSSTVEEGKPAGTVIGTLSATDQDSGGTYSYSLESQQDAAYFSISGSSLLTNAVFDFETTPEYSVSIRVTDGTESFVKTLVVSVVDANEVPTALTLSSSEIGENLPAGTDIGHLSATDPDAGDDIVFSIEGGVDAGSFSIVGSSLRSAQAFDYETKNSYVVDIKATDRGGLSLVRTFTITVADANDAPTSITLDRNSIDENVTAGATIGTLGAEDQDAGDSFVYEIADGADADGFTLSGNALKSAKPFDYETKAAYGVKIKVTDASGGSFTQTMAIDINNVNEAPVAEDQSFSTRDNQELEGQIAASDPERDALTYAIVDQLAEGELTVDAATGIFHYKPKSGFYEDVTFTFKANDGEYDSNVATITVSNRQTPSGSGGTSTPTPPKFNAYILEIAGKGGVIIEPEESNSNRIRLRFDRNSLQELPTGLKSFTLQVDEKLVGADVAIDPWLLDQLRARNLELTIQAKFGSVTLPSSLLELAGQETLNVSLDLASTAAPKGLHAIGTPVTVSLHKGSIPDSDGATLDEGFLKLRLSAGDSRPTTAVRVLPDGSYRPVPSRIVKDGNEYDVEISSREGGTFALVAASPHFTDTEGWSQPYIEELASRLIVNGVGGNKFEPNRGVSRAEFAKIVVQSLNLVSMPQAGGFEDTASSAWYAESVAAAVEEGLFTGYADGTFRPAQPLSRQEAYVVLARAIKLAGIDRLFSDEEKKQALSRFSDASSIPAWAQDAVAVSRILGLIHEDGEDFRPTAPMTREQLCYAVVQLLRAGGLVEQE